MNCSCGGVSGLQWYLLFSPFSSGLSLLFLVLCRIYKCKVLPEPFFFFVILFVGGSVAG